MKRSFAVLAIAYLFVAGTLQADDKKNNTNLNQAKQTVDRIRQADPPQVSTTTKHSAAGQPVTDYKPKPKTLKTTEPPPPKKKN